MHFSDIGVFLGRCEFAKVDYYTKDPVKHQERILKSIIEKNKDTEYGKKIGFDKTYIPSEQVDLYEKYVYIFVELS